MLAIDRRFGVAMLVLAVAASATVGCGEAPTRSALPSAAAGAVLYAQNGCARCHGPSGHGDGPVGETLDPRPRDFRDASAFKNGIDTGAIADTIATGVPEGGRMPTFGHLTATERRSLALFVISLRDPLPKGSAQP